jgi:hypothetical protein
MDMKYIWDEIAKMQWLENFNDILTKNNLSYGETYSFEREIVIEVLRYGKRVIFIVDIYLMDNGELRFFNRGPLDSNFVKEILNEIRLMMISWMKGNEKLRLFTLCDDIKVKSS